MSSAPLAGRVVLVTGVSRRRGIGHAVARRLGAMGASLFVTHHRAHDVAQPWGADDLAEVVAALREAAPRVVDVAADLADPDAPAEVVAAAVAAYGHVDALVCVHARSGSDASLSALDPAWLDAHWQVNARATLLLTRSFAAQHDGRPGGRVVWFGSGQHLGPMRSEVAYAASKGALIGALPTVADELVGQGILLNAVNPGPVDTGHLPPEQDFPGFEHAFPLGRYGTPDDAARLVAWLVSDEGAWMTGQYLSSEGGFRRG
ncbi:SDR family oxidoreductase [Actinocorallia sp. A-T 12471]|uniref:SDR family oxidoreductase n=1 Tax=Actinocorallia sp. A-T 12471 TaxID=3089813 RepID=UPI0029CE31E4|nr:SDR family oxidoreductase [Actinocorallia sp. A-T 12471]MDX6739880.1 SDR family oxidoreductase [Actinocorallia sp. A-T 12471]